MLIYKCPQIFHLKFIQFLSNCSYSYLLETLVGYSRTLITIRRRRLWGESTTVTSLRYTTFLWPWPGARFVMMWCTISITGDRVIWPLTFTAAILRRRFLMHFGDVWYCDDIIKILLHIFIIYTWHSVTFLWPWPEIIMYRITVPIMLIVPLLTFFLFS